jgi:hypothetical protein
MSRKNVKVDIPVYQPDKLITLCEDVYRKHTALGDASPLLEMDMVGFNAQLTLAKSKRDTSREQRRQSESTMQESDVALGTAIGQTSETPGTMYNRITLVRDELLVSYTGNEEALSEWGFNVVISESVPGKRKSPPQE